MILLPIRHWGREKSIKVIVPKGYTTIQWFKGLQPHFSTAKIIIWGGKKDILVT